MQLVLAVIFTLLLSFTTVAAESGRAKYPEHWWEPVPKEGAPSWEILPQEAAPGEVILSKRNELGLLSNFADTPFEYRHKRYPSLEGFWQMMKYPEGPKDPRAKFPGIEWRYSREQVSQMIGFEAKDAGSLASVNMDKMGINWVSFEGRRMTYRTADKGKHFDLIVKASWEKIRQNAEVRRILLATGDLVLRPDHKQGAETPPAWKYHEIYMDIRSALQQQALP